MGKVSVTIPASHTLTGLKCACLALIISACTTASGSFCDISKPIRPTQAEIAALSDTQVTAILEHNTKGQRLCGWKP